MLYELGQAEARSWAEEAGFIKPAPGGSASVPGKFILESGAAPSGSAGGRAKGGAAGKERGLLRRQPAKPAAGASAATPQGPGPAAQRRPLPAPSKNE
jgi:hypothetical protein